MAEMINQQAANRSSSFSRYARKAPGRIDMTPMVDLGFLLITFFLFTATMSEPRAIKLIMPDSEGAPTPVRESGALTILPAGRGKVAYFEGQFQASAVRITSVKEIRGIIGVKKRMTPEKQFVVIIKPLDAADYRAVVDILDEMQITAVQRYALADLTREEKKYFKES